jgi:methyl-accepting chemotaxis protein
LKAFNIPHVSIGKMLEFWLLGTMFAGLNGLGLWQSVPLTPISPSNSYLMRSIGSLEVVGAIYGSRRLRPYVFTEDDAISSEDQQLQHLIALEETKHNMYILRKDTEGKSFHLNTPPVAAPTYCPLVTTISNQMTDYLLQQLLEKVEREATLAKETNERNFLLATIAFVFLVAGQFLVLLNTTQTKHSIADMKLVLGEGLYKSINSDFQRLHKLLKSTILEVCEQLQTDIARFRWEFTQVKDVFGAFAFKCEDQFKYFAHITGANQRTNQQVIDQRLEEIGDDMENLVQIVPQILQEMQFMNDAVRNATGGSNGHAISPDTAD